jgi:hypothetical protein
MSWELANNAGFNHIALYIIRQGVEGLQRCMVFTLSFKKPAHEPLENANNNFN